MTSPLFSTLPRRILLVCTQRIGDVLLTTPLARSMKRAWPQVQVDALVLPGAEGVLVGNPDFSQILAFPQRVGLREKFRQFRSLWQRYDLAISPLATDRARLFCRVAGRRRVGVLQAEGERSKALLLDRWLSFDDLDTHTVAMGLQLTRLLGIAPVPEVVPPSAPLPSGIPPAGAYVVLHPSPMFRYKQWTEVGWVTLARWLAAQGFTVVLTGGPAEEERQLAERVRQGMGADTGNSGNTGEAGLNLAGRLSLAETAALIRQAALFVGPDTAVTHIAAATGVPTLALFGPSNPVKWGPWPKGWATLESPWARRGSARQGNVHLLQGEDGRGCVPCLLEGCERHVHSESQCLLTLSPERVIAAAAGLMAG